MRLRLPALLATSALLLVGCGGDEPDTPADTPTSATVTDDAATGTTDAPTATTGTPPGTTPTASTPTAASGDAAALEGLLLTPADVPDGWSEMDVASAQDDGPNAASNICGEATGNLDWTDDASATAKAAFSGGQGTLVVQQVSEMGGIGQATVALNELATAAGECEQWEEDGTTFTVQALEGVPVLGDSMTAVRVSAESQGGPMTVDMVAWRHGTITDGVAYYTFGSEPDTDELVSILEAAEAKFS